MADCDMKLKPFQRQRSGEVEDRISALPDCLLHHILSFLTVKEVLKTSFLSRRWRCLWKYTPCLDFGRWEVDEASMLVDFMTLSLIRYESPKVQRFSLCFMKECIKGCRIDWWIQFAVRHDVEKLTLGFSGGYLSRDIVREYSQLYELPCFLFKCASLTELSLTSCKVGPLASASLPSLKALYLCNVAFLSKDINVLLSGCPLLEKLAMDDCNNFDEINKLPVDELNIFAPNLYLRSLMILDCFKEIHGLTMDIFAPNLLSLEVSGCRCGRTGYHIKNLSSIIDASLMFDDLLYSCNDSDQVFEEGQSVMELLNGLRQAKTLKLCSWCFLVISIREAQGMQNLAFNTTCLELRTGMENWELPGIISLLRSSPHLETLVMHISWRSVERAARVILDEHHLDDREYWKTLGHSLLCRLQHLKTVKIYGFLESRRFSLEDQTVMVADTFLEALENEIEFVKFLLKNSVLLDKMVIRMTEITDFSKCAVKPELLHCLTKKLHLFPRASPNVEIVLS